MTETEKLDNRVARAVSRGLTVLVLAVLAIGAITVLSWMPADKQTANHSVLPALKLSSPDVAWSMSEEDIYLSHENTARYGWPKLLARENHRAVTWQTQSILADPNGWAAAGLHFKEIPAKGRISFKWVTPSQLQAACSESNSPKEEVLGCASPGVKSCTVYLGINVILSDSTGVIDPVYPGVLNHEIGHCLGFEHTSKGLMAPDISGIEYPSAAMLHSVGLRLGKAPKRSWWSLHWEELLLLTLMGSALWWAAFRIGMIKQQIDLDLESSKQINEVLEIFGPQASAGLPDPILPG